MSTLAAFQSRFADAVHGRDVHEAIAALIAQPAFAVYRNTALGACIDALVANYPAVACLVGRDWFRAAAGSYAAAYPPDDARMLFYGRHFPQFLADHSSMHGLAYLAGVASIDRLWTEASTAGDAATIGLVALATLSPEDLPRVRVSLHPAARWYRSELPTYSIWDASRRGASLDDTLRWQSEFTLLTRAGTAVRAMTVTAAACALLDACADGYGFQEAIDRVMASHPDTDMQDTLASLFDAGAFAALSISPPESP